MTASAYELNYNLNGLNLRVLTAFNGADIAEVRALVGTEAEADIIYGYAYAGKEGMVNQLLVANPSLRSAAAAGYARAGKFEEIRKMGISDDIKSSVVFGYAQAGEAAQVRHALNADGGSKYLSDAVRGYASTNQKELLLELLTGLSKTLYETALKAAAKANHKALVDTLLKQLGIDLSVLSDSTTPLSSEAKYYLSFAVAGYSEGRHFEEALSLIKLGIPPMRCLSPLAPTGKLDKIDASKLLACITDTDLLEKMKNLMKDQFGLDTASLGPVTHISAPEIVIDSVRTNSSPLSP